MKAPLLTFALFSFFTSIGQFDKHLCRSSADVVFAFQLTKQKWVSVCQEKQELYIVYSFGTSNKIELQYPEVLDTSSWSKFSLKACSRGSSKQNAAMYFAFLHFINHGVSYEVYDQRDSGDDLREIGINIRIQQNKKQLKGILVSHQHSLLSLMDSEKIKKEEEE
jgi:hypothetical protein